jgi:hypothetical protein
MEVCHSIKRIGTKVRPASSDQNSKYFKRGIRVFRHGRHRLTLVSN